MFQFTTHNVINSLYDENGKAIWSFDNDILSIKRIHNFDKKYVTNVYKAEPTPPVFAQLGIKLSELEGVNKEDIVRILLYIGLSEGSNQSHYANDFYKKGRPFVVEFKYTDDEDAKKVADLIKKFQLNFYGEKMVNVDSDSDTLYIKAVNEFQRFVDVQVEKLNKDAYHGLGEYESVKGYKNGIELEELEDGAVVPDKVEADTLRQGVEGFGTYTWLLHNLRLPTSANLRWNSPNENEMPIPGATYTQYTIHYCVDRGVLGNNAVGDKVTSMTTHVLYINDAVLADATSESGSKFDDDITELAGENFEIVPAESESNSGTGDDTEVGG